MFRKPPPLDELSRGVAVEFKLEPDEDGYFDRECPNEECGFIFKVHEEDWRDIFRDEAVFCPMCRHEATADQWLPSELQQEVESRLANVALASVEAHLDGLFSDMAQRVNRGSRSRGGISMTMTRRPAQRRSAWLDLRLASREQFDLKVQCGACDARIAVVGSAFFCASCGHSSAERLFDEALDKARLKAEKAPSLRAMFEASGERDQGAVLARSLVESALADCVVALQRLAEQLYLRFPGVTPPRMNAFQRLGEIDRLWMAEAGEGVPSWLVPEELERLNVLIQRRHLLAHTDGVVDERYVQRSGDTSYKVGQRLVISAGDVLELAALTAKIGEGLRRTAPGPRS